VSQSRRPEPPGRFGGDRGLSKKTAIERSRLVVDELGVPQPLALGRLAVALVVVVGTLLALVPGLAATGGERLRSWRDGVQFLPFADAPRTTISLLFPLHAAVPPPRCLMCDGPASPPRRMGWLESPERQAVFVVCGPCPDCADAELEKRIVNKITASPAEPSVAAAPVAVAPPSARGIGIGSQPAVV
jgi:hypothetical protein